MPQHQVLISGAGPTGLTLAAELALAGIDVALIERRTSQALEGSRAGGLHPRTLELFDQRGKADRFIAQGQPHPVVLFAGAALNTSDLPSRFPYWLAIWQEQIERILADWVSELGVPIYRGQEVTGFAQDGNGVDVTVSGGEVFRCEYLVGCDGGRSVIRKAAGIGFPGWEPSISYLIAEAEATDEPEWGVRYTDRGINALAKLEDGAQVRMVLTEQTLRNGEATEADVRNALNDVYGTDFGLHSIRWLSRFTDAARQADRYRERRVLLAGDAAHIHSPAGGQGLNLGVQDAMNLGWKLARVVNGLAGEGLLDTYQTERHPVGEAVLKHTLGSVALSRGDERTQALKGTLAHIMQMDEPRRWYGATMSGLAIDYAPDASHPLIGRRMPDLDLQVGAQSERLYPYLRAAKPLLLVRTAVGDLIGAPLDGVTRLVADWPESMILPILGAVPAPDAVLIRPDGYVAWAGDPTDATLNGAITGWFDGDAAD